MCSLLNFGAEQTVGLTSVPILMYTHDSMPNKIRVPFIDVSTACSLTIYIHRVGREIKRTSEPNFRPCSQPMSINDQSLPLRDTPG